MITTLRSLTPSALPFLTLLLTVSGQLGCSDPSFQAAAESESGDGESMAISVSATPALSRPAYRYLQSTGSFVALEVSEVAPEASGRIMLTPVDMGAFVKKGQVLVRLDDRDAQLRLQQAGAARLQAEAALRQAEFRIGLESEKSFQSSQVPEVAAAEATFNSASAEARRAVADADRYAELIESGDVSRSTYEQMRTQAETALAQAEAARQQYEAAINAANLNYQGVANAKAALEVARVQVLLARKALEDTVIVAPFEGYVSARPFSVGEFVTNASHVATVVRIAPIKLNLQIPEVDSARIQPGMRVTARIAAHPEREFTGTITAINPTLDPASRAVTVEVLFPNEDASLRPGMFAVVQVLLPETDEAVFVPRGAVLRDEDTGSSHVFLLKEKTARLVVVQTGKEEDRMVRILSGLSADDTVALSRLGDLFDGAPVQIHPSTDALSKEFN